MLMAAVLALESVRINLFSEEADRERALLLRDGFRFNVPEQDLSTPHRVIEESKWCNTPVHRRQKARDNSVM